MARISARELSVAAFIALFVITPCVAEPLTLEVSWARAEYDQRTGRPVLILSLTGVSKEAFYYLSLNNIGRRAEVRIDGKVILTPAIREPISAGTIQISGADLTNERIKQLVGELSKSNVRVEIDIVDD
jgi:preprotein translocase subunit SecD